LQKSAKLARIFKVQPIAYLSMRKNKLNEKLNQLNSKQFLAWLIFCLGVWVGVCGCALIPRTSLKKINRISKESLKSKLEDPSIVILDVRRPQDWIKNGIKIKGAIQENPYKFSSWYSRYSKAKTIILYCA
jgi:hypothetical protein